MSKKIIVLITIAAILLSGCVSSQADKPAAEVSATSTVSPLSTASPVYNQVSQSSDQNKIKELEDKVNLLQKQVDELQTRINRVDLLKPSDRNLIPQIPFRLEVKWGEWQTPLVYTFKENEVEISESGNTDIASYKIFRNNNTIKISSKKYDYFGIVLYDEYATAIHENGWIVWAKKYKIFPPRYNPETQKYELS